MPRISSSATWSASAAIVCCLALTPVHHAKADVIYAATGGSAAGSLYTLNQSTGLATLVGALVDSSGSAYSLTGLAFDPLTGTLYGTTTDSSPTHSQGFVSVNPSTGLVTFIGGDTLGTALSDISFSSNGTLYGWEAASNHELVTINITTGVATVVPGATPFSGFGGEGLAFGLDGTLYSTPDGSTNPPGTLRTLNPANGAFLTSVTLSNSPIIGRNAINSMDVSSAGVLYGTNDDFNGPQLAHLVTINETTGQISDVGSQQP